MKEKSNYINDGRVDVTSFIEDKGHVIAAFNLTTEELINLTGGVPSPHIRELELKVISETDEAIELFVKTDLYEVTRVLNFADRVISNTHMYVFQQQKRIGTRLFCNQVAAARNRGFTEIQTTAMGRDAGDNWTGFYAWGRLGYQMFLGDDENFRRLMEKSGRREENIWELLSAEDGKAFWMEKGFTWMAQFLLEDGSNTMPQLRTYLQEKNLSYLLI